MTTQADPWASASQATQTAQAAARPADPNADPFASPDDFGGASGPRGPKLAEILNRLVIIKPIEKKLDQPIPGETDGKTQNIWVSDLTVLGDEPITVFAPAVEKNGKSYPESSETFRAPYTWNHWYAYGRGLEVKLDGVHADPNVSMLLGVVKRCPTGVGYRAGETWETIEKRWAEYRAALLAGRDIAKPQFSWGLIDATPEQRAVALAWFRGLSG